MVIFCSKPRAVVNAPNICLHLNRNEELPFIRPGHSLRYLKGSLAVYCIFSKSSLVHSSLGKSNRSASIPQTFLE